MSACLKISLLLFSCITTNTALYTPYACKTANLSRHNSNSFQGKAILYFCYISKVGKLAFFGPWKIWEATKVACANKQTTIAESLYTFGKYWFLPVFCWFSESCWYFASFLLVFSWFSSTHHEKFVYSQSFAGFQNMSILKFQTTLNYWVIFLMWTNQILKTSKRLAKKQFLKTSKRLRKKTIFHDGDDENQEKTGKNQQLLENQQKTGKKPIFPKSAQTFSS